MLHDVFYGSDFLIRLSLVPFMGLRPPGSRTSGPMANKSRPAPSAVLDTLIGYWEPYATSHDKLDAQPETFVQVENAAKSLVNMVRAMRSGGYKAPDAGLRNPRQK
jgi:hypothetical protein